jgi:hypothetical protein
MDSSIDVSLEWRTALDLQVSSTPIGGELNPIIANSSWSNMLNALNAAEGLGFICFLAWPPRGSEQLDD